MDLQIYSTKVIVESEADTSLVTLQGVDLAEIVAQVSPQDLLELLEASDIADFLSGRDE
jgi:hypothetical protein